MASKIIKENAEGKTLNDLKEQKEWITDSLSEVKDGLRGLRGLSKEDDKLIIAGIKAFSILEEVNKVGTPDLKREIRSAVKKELHNAAEVAIEAKSQNAAFSYLNQFVYKHIPLVGNRIRAYGDTNEKDEYSDAIYAINKLRLELHSLKEQSKDEGSDYRIVAKLGGIDNKASVERVLDTLRNLLDTSDVSSGVNAIRNIILAGEIQKYIVYACAEAKKLSRSGALVGEVAEYLNNFDPKLNYSENEKTNKATISSNPGIQSVVDSAEKTIPKINKKWKIMIKYYVNNVIWADEILRKESNKGLNDALHNNSLTDEQAIQLYKLLMTEWVSKNEFASSLLPKVNAISTAEDMLLVGRMAIKKYLNEFTRVKLNSLGFSKEHIALVTSENEDNDHYLLKDWEGIQLRLWQLFLSKKKKVDNSVEILPPPPTLEDGLGQEATDDNAAKLEDMLRSMPPPLVVP